MKKQSEHDLMVIVDESIAKLDLMYRIIFCFAEISINEKSTQSLQKIQEFEHEWRSRNSDKKFHLTDFTNSDDIEKIINLILDLRPTVKIFTRYTIDERIDVAKVDFLGKIIKTTLNFNYRNINVTWRVEKAHEYEAVVKQNNLTIDASESIIPDLFCSLFARILSMQSMANRTPGDTKIQEQYERIKPLIRLERIEIKEGILRLDGKKVL